jgi:hypothetical protein
LGRAPTRPKGKIFELLVLVQLSAKNLLINSHQAHQIAAHPVHHLPMQMGLPDVNASSLGIIMALDVMLGWRGD